ncbi:unnamed protein product [Polarella glacialis]|uniref:Uncharacterized protein n=1 Tax=Polarella glacialis TaxID=89957 RepID=A0A813IFJ6_POLGL|nr:unnamed protein product [Polarella glacialis]
MTSTRESHGRNGRSERIGPQAMRKLQLGKDSTIKCTYIALPRKYTHGSACAIHSKGRRRYTILLHDLHQGKPGKKRKKREERPPSKAPRDEISYSVPPHSDKSKEVKNQANTNINADSINKPSKSIITASEKKTQLI